MTLCRCRMIDDINFRRSLRYITRFFFYGRSSAGKMSSKRGSKDSQIPIIECAVCGKQFPRGLVDLNRHVNATTLQHLFSDTKSASYPYGCEICGIHFTKEEHLTCHNQFSSCGLGGMGNNTNTNTANQITEDLDTERIRETQEDVAAKVDDSAGVEDSTRTLECMVCGKLFPRGPVDLQRHATAVTLKHLVSSKRSSTFSHGCTRCGLWMTTAEHLKSHEAFSTCNPDIVWPENADTMAGLRAITKTELARQKQAQQTVVSSPKPSQQQQPNATPFSSSSNKGTTELSSKRKSLQVEVELPSSPISSRKRTIRKRYGDADSPYLTNKHTSASDNTSSSHVAGGNTSSELDEARSTEIGSKAKDSKKRLYDAIREDLSLARQKKSKVIVPEERQAFFSIVSLLIEPKSVPLNQRVTEENYQDFIPEQHKPLIAKLQSCLLYE